MTYGKCSICGMEKEYAEMYEYRGAIACDDCFDELKMRRDDERAAVIEEQKHKTERFRGLDLSDSLVGKANREILRQDIEIAKRESKRLFDYERGGNNGDRTRSPD